MNTAVEIIYVKAFGNRIYAIVEYMRRYMTGAFSTYFMDT